MDVSTNRLMRPSGEEEDMGVSGQLDVMAVVSAIKKAGFHGYTYSRYESPETDICFSRKLKLLETGETK